jgi:hypothetical protein
LNSNKIIFYFRNFVDDDDVGPICMPLVPPTAIVNGVAFSCVMSCRRLNSFNLSAANCDETLFVDGGLFSTLFLTLSKFSSFKSGFPDVILTSLDDVDDDDDGGLASKKMSRKNQFEIFFSNLQVKYGS